VAKAKPKSPFTGRWRITSMSMWDQDYLDKEVEAFIEFEDKGLGSFQFGYVGGQIDCRVMQRDGKQSVEFTWDGGDDADGTPLTGRGGVILDGDKLNGEFFIHLGDDSEFEAKRKTSPSKPKR
jgi:hypothetical protein